VINVVNIPGVFGEGKEGRAYFTEKIIDILEEIIRRENTYNFVDFFTDEAGDIWPCQQQLSGDQYTQVAERTPPLLSQLRKQNSFLYCAAHGTQDMHYFVWKIKSNTICYMNGSNVKSFHSEISQSSVNRLDRGSMWVAPKSLEEYALAYEENDLEWSGSDEHLDLEIKDSLADRLETETQSESSSNPELECSQCGYEWESRVDSPKKCPECQSKKWDE
jgi:predicted Zn-ribbon and HTH transcriptional regulator